MRIIENLQCTAVIATDGSHNDDIGNSNTARAFSHTTSSASVVCVPTLVPNENWADGHWQHREAIPIYARAAVLPKKFGVHKSDIGHGEGLAVCQALDILKLLRSSVIGMGSKSLREVAQNIRDRTVRNIIDRNLIRTIISEVSKCIGSRMDHTFELLEDQQPTPVEDWKVQHKLHFMELCKKWTECEEIDKGKSLESNPQWKANYWDTNMSIPIIKVDSHQLNKAGTSIKTKP